MILVTGGLGFIGSHTSRSLLDIGEQCVIGQRRTGQVPDFLAGDAVVERLDCTDLDNLLDIGKRHQITGVVHLAAPGLGGAPLEHLWTSTQSLFNVLRAAQQWGVGRVVLASTIGVYAGATAYREDVPLPLGGFHPIPAAKKVAEVIAGAVPDIDTVSVRIGAIWGPLGREASPFFGAPQIVHAAVRGTTEAAPPYADDGIDMCYVRDCGRAIALLMTAETLGHRTYNIGSGRVTTNREVATAIEWAVPGATPELREGRSPRAPVADAALDITRLRQDTGFEPGYDLDLAVADYVRWLRAGHAR